MLKKILLPTPDYPPKRGGVARYLTALKQTFPDVFDILFWEESMPRGAELRNVLSHASLKHDAVWTSHIFPIGMALWRNRLFGGKPYAIILHGMDFDLARRNVVRTYAAKMILRRADLVITNSDALAEEVRVFCGVQPFVVYPAVSDALVEAAMQDHTHEPHADSLRLLTVARLVERKGHLDVLEVIQDLPDVTYTIVGSGPMESVLRKRIEDLGMTDRVIIRTDVEDHQLPDLYRSHDVFVMPSKKSSMDREGFGTVYIEAGLFALPVIATRHPGVDEAVLHGSTGLLTDGSLFSLRTAIQALKEHEERRQLYGRIGRDRALGLFTRQAQFGKLKKILKK